VMLELLEIDAVFCNFAEHLAIRRTRYAKANRQRRAVAQHPDLPHVVAEIFAAELRADAERLRHFQDLLLHLEIAEGVAVGRTMRRQRIEIARGGKFYGLHAEFGRSAADHDR